GVRAGGAAADPAFEVAEEDVHADLVRHPDVEVGSFGREMAGEFGLGGDVAREQRDGPGELADAATPFFGDRLAFTDDVARAWRAWQHGTFFGAAAALLAAEGGGDVFAEVVMRETVRVGVAPHVSAGGLDHVGDFLQDRVTLRDDAFIVVGALLVAVVDLPVALEVVGADGGVGPDVAIAGDLTGVEEVVEHAELERELVLVGRDGRAVHGERGIAVADGVAILNEVAEDLVVGAVFLDDVDDVLDGVGARREGDVLLGGLHAIGGENFGRGGFEVERVEIDSRE